MLCSVFGQTTMVCEQEFISKYFQWVSFRKFKSTTVSVKEKKNNGIKIGSYQCALLNSVDLTYDRTDLIMCWLGTPPVYLCNVEKWTGSKNGIFRRYCSPSRWTTTSQFVLRACRSEYSSVKQGCLSFFMMSQSYIIFFFLSFCDNCKFVELTFYGA